MADRHELQRSADEPDRSPAETVEGIVTGAGRAAGWLLRKGWDVTRKLPGGEIAERQLHRLEQVAVTEVRKRLDGLDGRLASFPTRPFSWRPAGDDERGFESDAVTAQPLDPHDEPLRAAMAALLNRSVSDSRAGARQYLHATILRELVPDEARILAALSDGTAYPLVHVVTRSALGGGQRTVLANASSVGRAAGVLLPEHVPVYVSRLLGFGLVEIGDEDPSLTTQYDILLTEDYVRAAEEQAGQKRRSPKFVRHTLRLSGFGEHFWSACDPSRSGLPPAADA